MTTDNVSEVSDVRVGTLLASKKNGQFYLVIAVDRSFISLWDFTRLEVSAAILFLLPDWSWEVV